MKLIIINIRVLNELNPPYSNYGNNNIIVLTTPYKTINISVPYSVHIYAHTILIVSVGLRPTPVLIYLCM